MSLIDVRKTTKAKKPNFTRQDTAKKKGIEVKWRRPKGLQSKLRLHKRGRKIWPSQGWRSPSSVRGLSAEGKHIVSVASVADLKAVGKDMVAVVSGTLGQRKKVELVKEAQKQNITLLNVKDLGAYVTSVDNDMKERKKKVKKVVVVKKEEAKDAKKKTASKTPAAKDKQASAEQPAKKEKTDKDKVLTKKEQ